jgi:PBP1b-binding outer membrane lipoprotein LpoB
MKRALASALILGVCSMFGLTGCSDESKVKEQTTASTPDGSTTVTKETKVDSSGSNPPAAPTTTEPAK